MSIERETTLNSVSFDELLVQQKPHNSNRPTIDLANVGLMTPSPIVQIAAISHALARTGRVLTVSIDPCPVRTYLIRCGFFDALVLSYSFLQRGDSLLMKCSLLLIWSLDFFRLFRRR